MSCSDGFVKVGEIGGDAVCMTDNALWFIIIVAVLLILSN